MAKEVFRDVGPESRVEGAGVQGALGAVSAARTGGKRPTRLPLGAVVATQNGEDTVFPFGRVWGHCDRGRTGAFICTLLTAHLLLLDLEERLLWRDREKEKGQFT